MIMPKLENILKSNQNTLINNIKYISLTSLAIKIHFTKANKGF